MYNTRKRGSATRGWHKSAPYTSKQRKRMMKRCGHKCFLGPHMSFPVCNKYTCKINKKGVQSAYNRARQFKRTQVAYKAKNILKRMK